MKYIGLVLISLVGSLSASAGDHCRYWAKTTTVTLKKDFRDPARMKEDSSSNARITKQLSVHINGGYRWDRSFYGIGNVEHRDWSVGYAYDVLAGDLKKPLEIESADEIEVSLPSDANARRYFNVEIVGKTGVLSLKTLLKKRSVFTDALRFEKCEYGKFDYHTYDACADTAVENDFVALALRVGKRCP